MVLLSAKGTGKDMRFFLFLPALADMRALYRSDRSTQEETQCGDAHAANQLPLRKRYSFFEFSICLSRACLGKIIVFILKVAQKTRFFTSSAPDERFVDADHGAQLHAPARKRPLLSSTFPAIVYTVLVNVGFILHKPPKRRFSHLSLSSRIVL